MFIARASLSAPTTMTRISPTTPSATIQSGKTMTKTMRMNGRRESGRWGAVPCRVSRATPYGCVVRAHWAPIHLVVSRSIAFALVATASSAFGQSTQGAPYRDAARPVDARVRDLLARMTLEEKFWQLFMIPGDLDDPANDYSHGVFGLQIVARRADTARRRTRARGAHQRIQRYFVERTRLGIPIIPFEEAVHGLVRAGATSFPQAIALAATWDTALMSRVATAIARGDAEPRHPAGALAGGQHRERSCAGDAWRRRTARTRCSPRDGACRSSSAFEHAGVVTTPKHFVANVGDGGRDSYPIDFDARLLDELYFPPFHAAILEGHARSVMSAYNSVDGSPATQNRALLTDKLQRDWGFHRIRHLRRRGDRRRDGAAPHRGEHRDRDDGRARGRARRDLPELVAAASAVPGRVQARADPRFRDRLGRRARAAREVRARTVRASVRGRRQREAGERQRGAPRARARGGARVDRPAQERRRRASAREDDSLDRRDRHRRCRGATRRLQRTRESQDLDSRRDRRGASRAARTASCAMRRDPAGSRASTPSYRPTRSRPTTAAAPCADCTASTSTTIASMEAPRLTRTDARVDFGWTLNSPGRGIPFDWYSVRWTGASRFHRAASGASASRQTTGIGCFSTASC